VTEATGQGFIPSPVRRELISSWKRAFEVLLPQEALRAIANDMLRASGTRYDWAAIRGWIRPSLLNRLPGQKGRWRPKPRGDRQFYCSDVAAKLLIRHGVRGVRCEEVTPGESRSGLVGIP
jgi:hypothetical protein